MEALQDVNTYLYAASALMAAGYFIALTTVTTTADE